MLKVKAYTAKDSWGGTGLFAAEDIPAGTLVWAYDPRYTRYISVEEYKAAKPKLRAELERYTYPYYAPEDGEVGLLLNLDDSRYMNHDTSPNTASRPDNFAEDIAVCLIKKGEELTCNYFDFDPDNMLYAMGVHSCKKFLMEDGSSHKKKSAGDR